MVVDMDENTNYPDNDWMPGTFGTITSIVYLIQYDARYRFLIDNLMVLKHGL